MGRPAKNKNSYNQQQQHQEVYEEDDEDYSSSHKDGRRMVNDDKSIDFPRSKHSETEQRRRSKINERFQMLRDLIPQNDQKRDRASFLLEVIQYINFLQEKLQAYEGTYQGYTPEIPQSLPWRGNCGADNFADQSQPLRNGSVDEGNIVLTPSLFTNSQNFAEPGLSAFTAFRITDHGAPRAVSMDVPLHQNTFEATPSHTPQGYFPDVSHLASQSRTQTWNAVQSCTPNELEESSISNAYSKGVLNNLTLALGSCGVNLSQANISVQFDVKKGTSSAETSTSSGFKDHDLISAGNQGMTRPGVRSRDDVTNQVRKRTRTGRNQ